MRAPVPGRPLALLVAILAALGPRVSAGAEPSLEVQLVPQRLGVEDIAQLAVTVTDAEVTGAGPVLGPLENLQAVSGPSTERRFSWVNGVATSSVRFTWLLQPLAVGPAVIGAVRVPVEGGELTSQPITVTIEAGSVTTSGRGRRSPLDPLVRYDPFEELLGRRSQREVRLGLRLLVPRTRIFQGEALPVTVVLDTTSSVERFEWVAPPTFPGWWTQQVETDEQAQPELVEAEGIRFHRFPVARYVLIPLKAGQLAIPSLSARVAIRGASLFAAPRWIERSTREQEISVTERPPAPSGFAGAVGSLRYRASVEPESIPFGESAVVTIELSGSGNLPLVSDPPAWPSCEGCDGYPPEEESRLSVDESGISGRRTWRMTIVPRQWGDLGFDPVELAVFDPKAQAYRRTSLGPLKLRVVAPTPTPAPTPDTVQVAEEEPGGSGRVPAADPAVGGKELPWLMVGAALVAGLLGGVVLTWLVVRRGSGGLPRALRGQSPAERARQLQAALESWWQEHRESPGNGELRSQIERLRRELEEVRFAPGRADHSQTVAGLETRLRALMRRP